MSESIRSGHLPLWNPYINFGIPAYGDMSGGYWSPITWLVASTAGYNAYTLTIELLLYLLIGGIGFFQLTGQWINDKRVRTIAGIAYMCCGYNIGHLQHFNWISGAAFLPWCLFSYSLVLQTFSTKNLVRSAVCFYMLLASAHPGITIGSAYFFIAYLGFRATGEMKAHPGSGTWKRLVFSNAFLLILLSALSLGLIIGYLDILPHFVRGEKISMAASLANPTTLQSWISVVLPFASVKNDAWFNTDVSMRNSYFSICLCLFLALAIFRKKSPLQMFLLITGFFFAFLSVGGIFKMFAYKYLPLTGFVRLNGEFRIFSILCFISIAAIELDRFISTQEKFTGKIRIIYYVFEVLVFSAIVFGLYQSINLKQSLFYNWNVVFSQAGAQLRLKALIDGLSFYDLLWIQGIFQLLLLWGIKWCLKKGNFWLLRNIVIADLILASLMNIPFTGVGKASVREVQAVLNHSPRGIPAPSKIVDVYQPTAAEEALVGDWDWYSKQVTINSESAYPVALKNMRRYFEMIDSTERDKRKSDPWIFFTGTGNRQIEVLHFTPNSLLIKIDSGSAGNIVYKQNYYPHWFYTPDRASSEKPVEPYEINFMQVPVSAATQQVAIQFKPTSVVWGMLISLATLIACCVYLVVPRPKRSSLS